MNFPFKLSHLNSNFALSLGFLNPALNNPAQVLLKSRVDNVLDVIINFLGGNSTCTELLKFTIK